MGNFYEGSGAKFGPWEDPRLASPGGCGGAIPDQVWAANAEELSAAVSQAMTHAMLAPVEHMGDALHVLEDPAWVMVIPDFKRRRVVLTANLLDLESPISAASVAAVARLNAGATPFKLTIEESPWQMQRLIASIEVQARPFIPVHLGQQLLDLVEYTFRIRDLAPELEGAYSFESSSREGLMWQWCGTTAESYKMDYASVGNHPRFGWDDCDDEDGEDH